MSDNTFLIRAAIAGMTGASNALHQFLVDERVKNGTGPSLASHVAPPLTPADPPVDVPPATTVAPLPQEPKRGRGRPPKNETAGTKANPPATPEPIAEPEDAGELSLDDSEPAAATPLPVPNEPAAKTAMRAALCKLHAYDKTQTKDPNKARGRVDQLLRQAIKGANTPLTVDNVPPEKYEGVTKTIDKWFADNAPDFAG